MAMEAPEDRIVIEGCEIKTFSPRAPRTNLDGEEMEAPKLVISLVGDLDRFIPYMNRITRVYRKSRAVRLSLEFVEQLEMPKLAPASDADKRPRLTDPLATMPAVDKNGHGAPEAAKDATPIEPIAGKVDEFLDEMGAKGPKGEERARRRRGKIKTP